MLRVVLVAFAALLAAIGVAACGGGGGSSDAGQIRAVVNRAITADDPSACDEIVTDLFIKTFYQGSVAGCKKNAEETSDDPNSVETTKIQIDGDRATADVKLVGGPADGQTIAASFADEDGQWKIDSLRFAGSGDTAGIGTASGTSTTGASPAANPVDLFYVVIRNQLKSHGTPDEAADCIVNKLRATITPEELSALNAGEDPSALGPKVSAIARQCGQQTLSGD